MLFVVCGQFKLAEFPNWVFYSNEKRTLKINKCSFCLVYLFGWLAGWLLLSFNCIFFQCKILTCSFDKNFCYWANDLLNDVLVIFAVAIFDLIIVFVYFKATTHAALSTQHSPNKRNKRNLFAIKFKLTFHFISIRLFWL